MKVKGVVPAALARNGPAVPSCFAPDIANDEPAGCALTGCGVVSNVIYGAPLLFV